MKVESILFRLVLAMAILIGVGSGVASCGAGVDATKLEALASSTGDHSSRAAVAARNARKTRDEALAFAVVGPAASLFAFYLIRWILTGRIRPWFPISSKSGTGST